MPPAASRQLPLLLSATSARHPHPAPPKPAAGLSEATGRVSRGTNIILDATPESADKWRELDQQVTEYPGQRTVKAIGSGGDDFVAAMTRCVESVVGTVHAECIAQRPSSKGNYVSVTCAWAGRQACWWTAAVAEAGRRAGGRHLCCVLCVRHIATASLALVLPP